jgi:hypothetical protein
MARGKRAKRLACYRKRFKPKMNDRIKINALIDSNRSNNSVSVEFGNVYVDFFLTRAFAYALLLDEDNGYDR